MSFKQYLMESSDVWLLGHSYDEMFETAEVCASETGLVQLVLKRIRKDVKESGLDVSKVKTLKDLKKLLASDELNHLQDSFVFRKVRMNP